MRDPLKSLPGNDRGRSRNHQMYHNAILLFTTYFMIKGKFENFALSTRAMKNGFFLKTLHKQAMLRFIEITEKKKTNKMLGHILLYSFFSLNLFEIKRLTYN